jgi:hypothetical protein
MASDNVLGAPTEGLGQTVTFAANGGAGIPQAQGPQRQAVRNSFQANAGQVSQGQYVADRKPDATLGVLLKMGADILAPKLEEERTASYMQGMQQAAEGQVVADIVDEQPWYSRMFGTTPLVDGARAYTAFAKAQEVSSAFEDEMPELRKLSGKEFAAEATRRVTMTKTGDQATDMLVMQQLTKTLPQKMATQAKQHYLYQQETLVNSQRAALTSAMTGVNKLAAKYRASNKDEQAVPGDAYMPGAENTDRGELLGAQLAVAEAVRRPEGMDPKLHSRNVTEAISLSLAEGNLDGAYTLYDAGVLKSLEPEHQQHLISAMASAERQKRATLPTELVRDIAAMKNAEYTSDPAGIVQAHAAINAKYAKLTGAREPLFGNGDLSTTLAQWERVDMQRSEALARAHATATKAADKEAAYKAVVDDAAGRLLVGQFPASATEKQVQEAWNKLAAEKDQTKVFAARATMQLNNDFDKTFQAAFRINVGNAIASTDPSAMHNVYVQQYLPLVNAAQSRGTAVASAYLGGDLASAMERYHELRQSRPGDDSEEARIMGVQIAAEKPVKPLGDSKRDNAIREAAKTGFIANTFNKLFGTDVVPMSATTERALANYLAPAINAAPDGMDIEQAFSHALSSKQQTNLTVMGGAFWERGHGETDFKAWMRKQVQPDGTVAVSPSEYNRATRFAFDATLEAQGLKDGGQVIQLADRQGVPVLMVMGIDKDEQQRWAVVTGTDIQQKWATRNDFKDVSKTPMADPRGLGKSALETALEAKKRREAKP